MTTVLSDALIQAYRETRYEVLGPPRFDFRIAVRCDPLAELYALTGMNTACFITAFNPRGKRLDDALNLERQTALVSRLNAQGLRHFSGRGVDPAGRWDAETSALVLGWDSRQARQWGLEWDQNAVVFADEKAVPELILLR